MWSLWRGSAAWDSARQALPYAVLLAVGLGAAAALGANLSNATPSAAKPYGWPGPAAFEAGVAAVRPELLLAASVVPAVWGTRILARLHPSLDGMGRFGASAAVHLGLLWVATLLGTAAGTWAAAPGTPSDAFWGFAVAHGLLASAFLALGILFGSLTRHAVPLVLGSWVGFAVLLDGYVRLRLYREAGYDNLLAGHFPSWFYLSQVLSPVAAYRGILILWRPGFRDWTEHAALDHATLPAWMTAGNFALLTLGLWVLLPIGVGAAIWAARRHTWRSRALQGIDVLPATFEE